VESTRERQYRLFRERPFTVLATAPLIAILAGGCAYIFASLLDGERWGQSAAVTAVVSLPAIALLLAVRKREARERFPYATRKIAWWIMVVAFALVALVGIGVILFADAKWNRKLAVVAALMMCGPSFVFFYDLLRRDAD
jgi:hypothetical protein